MNGALLTKDCWSIIIECLNYKLDNTNRCIVFRTKRMIGATCKRLRIVYLMEQYNAWNKMLCIITPAAGHVPIFCFDYAYVLKCALYAQSIGEPSCTGLFFTHKICDQTSFIECENICLSRDMFIKIDDKICKNDIDLVTCQITVTEGKALFLLIKNDMCVVSAIMDGYHDNDTQFLNNMCFIMNTPL